MSAAKKIDSKGRLLLGEKYAGTTVLLEELENGEVLIKPAVTIAASEKWLFANDEAMGLVLAGLKQAREGKTVTNPAFDKKKAWKSKLKD